jgi:Stage V sporulation protein AD (SpoVAD).
MQKIIYFSNKPTIISHASCGGQLESKGAFGGEIDITFADDFFGESTFEACETKMVKTVADLAMARSKAAPEIIFAGDLLNQCVATSFAFRDVKSSFCGIYGACSNMSLSLALSSVFVNSGAVTAALASTSSHFCSAERQYRFPLEYASQREKSSGWTVTGAGAVVVGKNIGSENPYVNSALFGRLIDLGVKDIGNMGAAMAPAAADTISRYLKLSNTSPADFDAIYTGDLGSVGSNLLYKLLETDGIDITKAHKDCGMMVYRGERKDIGAGGSGCGCSALTLCAHILPKLKQGKLRRILFCATGALMSPLTVQQGESIPSVCHAVEILH